MSARFGQRLRIASVAVVAMISLSGDLGSPLSGSYLDGQARLISIEPLPDGEICIMAPESPSLVPEDAFALEQRSVAAVSGPSSSDRRTVDLSQRKPVRMIRDPYPAFSAIAVDQRNNEVVITDQNLFQILVYDRMANTPATAPMTEPIRVLGGEQTEIEFQSSVYIDPKNGDIYAGNNDTVNKLVIFSREAKGNVAPTRELNSPDGRTFGIGVHEEKEEMYLVIQKDDAVVVYPKSAQGDDMPLRLLQGDRTMLADPHGLVLDIKNRLMFVTNYGAKTSKQEGQSGERQIPTMPLSSAVPGSGQFVPPSITVYSMDATGNTPPLRVIQGPKARLNWATGIDLDPERGELYVANDMGDEVLVFDSSAQGDVEPKRILKGPKSMVKNPLDVYLDLQHDELWVANFGNHSATVYRRDAAGDTAPLRVIRGGPADAPAPMMGNPHPVAYDSKRDQILVPN